MTNAKNSYPTPRRFDAVRAGSFIKKYDSKNWIERRKEFLENLSDQNTKLIEWQPITNEIARIIHNALRIGKKNHYHTITSNFKMYTIKNFEINEGEYYDGINFKSEWNTRDILLNEAVIEIEGKDFEKNLRRTYQVSINLLRKGIHHTVFYSEGMRTPHIHAYNLLPQVQTWSEKIIVMELLCRDVVPFEYFHLVDRALWGEHTIALEFAKHYRTGKIKKLLYEVCP